MPRPTLIREAGESTDVLRLTEIYQSAQRKTGEERLNISCVVLRNKYVSLDVLKRAVSVYDLKPYVYINEVFCNYLMENINVAKDNYQDVCQHSKLSVIEALLNYYVKYNDYSSFQIYTIHSLFKNEKYINGYNRTLTDNINTLLKKILTEKIAMSTFSFKELISFVVNFDDPNLYKDNEHIRTIINDMFSIIKDRIYAMEIKFADLLAPRSIY